MVPANDWLSNFLKELDEEQTTAPDVANSDEPTDKATGLGSLEVLTAMDASSCPTTLKPSTALSEQAKKVKRTREKLRRDSLNSRYQQLSAVLELCESKKSDKEELVSAATDLIKRLRAEHVRLANTIMRFQDEKLQKADLLRALAMNHLRDEISLTLERPSRLVRGDHSSSSWRQVATTTRSARTQFLRRRR